MEGVSKATNSKGGRGPNWDSVAEKAYQAVLCESERTFAYVALATESDGDIGRLVFELYPELAPKTCANFLALCEKEGGYVGSAIHRVKVGGWMQGGDPAGNGDGGASASGSALADESFHLKHDQHGILGMAHSGSPHGAQ